MFIRQFKNRALLFALVLTLVSMISGIATASFPLAGGKSFKILAIGNSFSVDAMEHLYQIAQEAGAENIILGNLYIGGSSLSTHRTNAIGNLNKYRYYKNTNGTWQSVTNRSILYGLNDEKWDIITLQQASGDSGVSSSYSGGDILQFMIDYVNKHKNPEAKLAWHMTWAYQSTSTHAAFPTYGRNQMTMYNAIVKAVQDNVVPKPEFALVIPAGTAIQNVRSSYVGDILTRDGYHLSYNLGRYVAGLTWLYALTGLPIDDLVWVPNNAEVPSAYLPIIKEAVKAAVATPFAVTPSTYTTRPIPKMDGYELLDWQPVGCAYWNSGSSTPITLFSKENSTAANLCNFVSSGKMFTREELPVGSIIEVDPGYQYRPEGWLSLDKQSTREATVATNRVYVTEIWWGSYKYRAFNVSRVGTNIDISKVVDATAASFRIWVPKK